MKRNFEKKSLAPAAVHDATEYMKPPRVSWVGLVLLISACGGNGGGGGPGAAGFIDGCRTISGGGTRVEHESDCSRDDCTVQDAKDSIDNNFETYAWFVLQGDGGTVRLRASAQNGVVYPAGSEAGAVVLKDAYYECASRAVVLRTFLGEEEGDVYAVPRDELVTGERELQAKKIAFETTTPFDSVELEATSAGCVADWTRVYEFCASY